LHILSYDEDEVMECMCLFYCMVSSIVFESFVFVIMLVGAMLQYPHTCCSSKQ